MSEILERLANAEYVEEWLNPWDRRLERATGLSAPQNGADRMPWEIATHDWPRLAAEVKRLIVPRIFAGQVSAEITGDEDNNRVEIALPYSIDARYFLPFNNTTIVKMHYGFRRWAAVGITDNCVGLGMFAAEDEDGNVTAKLQHIPDEVVRKVIG